MVISDDSFADFARLESLTLDGFISPVTECWFYFESKIDDELSSLLSTARSTLKGE